MSSALPRITVRGVRSSWASSPVSRCSARMAWVTFSSSPSRVAPSAVISLPGGPSAKRRERSCSLQSSAVRAISLTGFSTRCEAQAATEVAAATSSSPAPMHRNRA